MKILLFDPNDQDATMLGPKYQDCQINILFNICLNKKNQISYFFLVIYRFVAIRTLIFPRGSKPSN